MSRYSEICWYFSNSTAQPAVESGGTTPITGSHWVIDRPERVSRVIPPTTTIRKIRAQQTNSQTATAAHPLPSLPRMRERVTVGGSASLATVARAVASVMSKSRSPETTDSNKVTPLSEADKLGGSGAAAAAGQRTQRHIKGAAPGLNCAYLRRGGGDAQ